MNSPYDNYRQQSVMTMTRGEMLVKLYDEIVRQINIAQRAIEEKDMAASNNSLQKCQKILNYLDVTLDMKYEVSAGLSSLYQFFIEKIISANVRKDNKDLPAISAMISDLRDTFAQAEKINRMGQQHSAMPQRSSAMSAVG